MIWFNAKTYSPVTYEAGEWDGLRSDEVLCKLAGGSYRVCRLYSGVLDGVKFSQFHDELMGEDIDGVLFWATIFNVTSTNTRT